MPGRTTGAHVAGDVATTGTAAADVTQSVPERRESAVPGQDEEVAREATAPRRARSSPAPGTGPHPAPGTGPPPAPGTGSPAPSPAPPAAAAPPVSPQRAGTAAPGRAVAA